MEHCPIWCIIKSVEEMRIPLDCEDCESPDDLVFRECLCSRLARLEVEKLFIMIAGMLEMYFCFVVFDDRWRQRGFIFGYLVDFYDRKAEDVQGCLFFWNPSLLVLVQ